MAAPAVSQADMAPAPYSNMSLHPHPSQNQRPPGGTMPAVYRQNQSLLAQQHHKAQANPALLKQQQQQQLARVPNAMPNALPNSIPMQPQSWQQQSQQQQQQHPSMQQAMATQAAAGNGGLQVFGNPNFHAAQARLPKLPGSAPFPQQALGTGRPLGGMSSAQMMSAHPQQRTNPALAPQPLPQPLAPPPQQQSQPLAPPPQPPGPQVLSRVNLPDLGAFGQPGGSQMGNRPSMQCNQGYPVNRTANQDLPFGYGAQSGNGLPSFPGESDLMETFLKNQSTQDWMDDLDELLANHQ